MSDGRQFGPFVATFSPSNGFNWKYHGEAAIVGKGLRLHERGYLESQDIPERGIRHSQTFDADAFSNGYCWMSWHQPWISTRQQTTNAIDRVGHDSLNLLPPAVEQSRRFTFFGIHTPNPTSCNCQTPRGLYFFLVRMPVCFVTSLDGDGRDLKYIRNLTSATMQVRKCKWEECRSKERQPFRESSKSQASTSSARSKRSTDD